MREWLLYPNIMGSMNPEQQGGGGGGWGGSEGRRVHNNVINMIIAKRTDRVG